MRLTRYRNGLIPSVRVTPPSGHETTLLLRQTSPGHYAAHVQMESGSSVPYQFELAQGGGLTRQDVQDAGVRSLSYPWSDELRSLPPDIATLQTLSTMTGGSLAPDTAEIFALTNDTRQIPRPMWAVLVATSLALFLLDILFRRTGGGRGISMRWWPRRKSLVTSDK